MLVAYALRTFAEPELGGSRVDGLLQLFRSEADRAAGVLAEDADLDRGLEAGMVVAVGEVVVPVDRVRGIAGVGQSILFHGRAPVRPG